MLAGADEDDRDHGHGHIPPPRQAPGRSIDVEGDSRADHEGQVDVGARQVVEVGDVIGLPQLLQLLLQEGISQRLRFRRGQTRARHRDLGMNRLHCAHTRNVPGNGHFPVPEDVLPERARPIPLILSKFTPGQAESVEGCGWEADRTATGTAEMAQKDQFSVAEFARIRFAGSQAARWVVCPAACWAACWAAC